MQSNTDRALLPGQKLDQQAPIHAMNGQHRRAVKQADRRTARRNLTRFVGTVDWEDFDE